MNLYKLVATSCSSMFVLPMMANVDRPVKPNIVFILTDDLGWQDVKCYDIDKPTPYETPNIDQLSTEGVMFTSAYSAAPTSSPSRGAILSGQHPARLQRTHVMGGNPIIPGSERGSKLITPWYAGRLIESETTIPKMLKKQGYISGHSGKWHIAMGHNTFPQPADLGFDFSISDRGVAHAMKPDRLSEFATTNPDDPYRLDKNGYPYDVTTAEAINFMEKNRENPFFLYMATWLVHEPIQMRCKALLEKYCKKMGVPFPKEPINWRMNGQRNPYYGAMVEMMDYYVGRVINYLKTTDDPRWNGHKLIENTYIIFASDNGGMEDGANQNTITDNFPLDKGKIWVQEGGIRVPMIVVGPNIPKNVKTNVVVNGLDIFPTIMNWTHSEVPPSNILDGCDLSTLLEKDPLDKNLIKNRNGEVRQYIFHHFPHARMQSSIIMDGYKLIWNFDDAKNKYELYQLYDSNNQRVDIEEQDDIASQHNDLVQKMGNILSKELVGMNAQFPYLNPYYKGFVDRHYKTCTIENVKNKGLKVSADVIKGEAEIDKALILYTYNGKEQYEEWFQMEADIDDNGHISAKLPKGTSHYILSVVDKNNFLVNYPRLGGMNQYKNGHYTRNALSVD